jgi:Ca2+-binding RTX toxin-like protein
VPERGRGIAPAAALAAAGLALLGSPSAAGAAVTCSFAGDTLIVQMSSNDAAAIGTSGNAITVNSGGASPPISCGGSPTMANTETVEVSQPGANLSSGLTLVQPPEGFAPGATDEPGLEEIEFDIGLGSGFDHVQIYARPDGPSQVHLGALAGGGTGANLNAPEPNGPDGDDLELSGIESLGVAAYADQPLVVDARSGAEPEFTDPVFEPILDIDGGGAADRLVLGAGGSSVDGAGGDDTVVSGPSIPGRQDSLDGGPGVDTLSYASTATSGVSVDLASTDTQATGGGGTDTLNTPTFEHVVGGPFGDDLRGTGSANTIDGREGDDVLRGRGGSDTLLGGGGADSLHANDVDPDAVLDCGAGAGDVLNRDPATLDPNGIVAGCEAMNPAVTAAPELAGFDPASGSDANDPRVRGTAPAGSSVDLFTSASCGGAPLADDVEAAQLTGDGIAVTVPDDSTTEFSATATTAAGGTSGCSNPITYSEVTSGGAGGEDATDRDPPDGQIRKVKVKGDDVKVTFRSDEAGSTFRCRLDRKRFRPCSSPKRYRKLGEGRHRVFVLATDAAGNEDDKAARARFEIG